MARKKEVINPFSSIVIDDAHYKTMLLKKYEKRKKWEKIDNSIVKAIIPGTIGKIFISEGDEVKSGQKLLILEAMKMFNQITSPADGRILKIHIKEGDKVAKEQLLVELKISDSEII